jgi:exportin-2 (importin alpha re-exporter)
VQRSDELYTVILYTLQGIQAPLLATFKALGQAVEASPNDAGQLKAKLESLRLICRIFYSLNYQDLPEFFEDHMGEWMNDFAKYLSYQNPLLVDATEEQQPSPIDNLQAAVINNLALYADKDEEPFLEFLPKFTELVWNLLLTTTSYPKHDTLATTSIRFLSGLVQKAIHKHLFEAPATLRQIVLNIVIPNLMFRDSDEERFEDDPREYMLTEVEGSDSESRRKCSQDLLRSMCRHFEGETTKICEEHVVTMLTEYTADRTGKWKAKDAAVSTCRGQRTWIGQRTRFSDSSCSLRLSWTDQPLDGSRHSKGKQRRCHGTERRRQYHGFLSDASSAGASKHKPRRSSGGQSHVYQVCQYFPEPVHP